MKKPMILFWIGWLFYGMVPVIPDTFLKGTSIGAGIALMAVSLYLHLYVKPEAPHG